MWMMGPKNLTQGREASKGGEVRLPLAAVPDFLHVPCEKSVERRALAFKSDERAINRFDDVQREEIESWADAEDVKHRQQEKREDNPLKKSGRRFPVVVHVEMVSGASAHEGSLRKNMTFDGTSWRLGKFSDCICP